MINFHPWASGKSIQQQAGVSSQEESSPSVP